MAFHYTTALYVKGFSSKRIRHSGKLHLTRRQVDFFLLADHNLFLREVGKSYKTHVLIGYVLIGCFLLLPVPFCHHKVSINIVLAGLHKSKLGYRKSTGCHYSLCLLFSNSTVNNLLIPFGCQLRSGFRKGVCPTGNS